MKKFSIYDDIQPEDLTEEELQSVIEFLENCWKDEDTAKELMEALQEPVMPHECA